MTILEIIITSTIGLVSGIAGSIIAPWVNWGIEQRKLRYNNRQRIIKDLKDIVVKEEFDRVKVVNSPSYLSIRSLLSEKLRQDLEYSRSKMIIYMGDAPVHPMKKMLMTEIEVIEKKWYIL